MISYDEVWESQMGQYKRVENPIVLWSKEWIELLDKWDVVIDDVVANNYVCLFKHCDPPNDWIGMALVVKGEDLFCVEIKQTKTVDGCGIEVEVVCLYIKKESSHFNGVK